MASGSAMACSSVSPVPVASLPSPSAIANAFAGAGQELFNAAVLVVAVLMLGWHNVWMARHGRAIAAEAKALGEAVAGGRRSMAALAIVVGVAVLREGAEVVLFLYGIVVSAKESARRVDHRWCCSAFSSGAGSRRSCTWDCCVCRRASCLRSRAG